MNQPPLPIEIDCPSVATLCAAESADGWLLVDCREADEHALVRIDGARLVPMSEIQDRVGELEAFRLARVVVYCHHGGRSLRVARWLRSQGFDRAQSMAGGIDAWAREVDPALPRY